MGDAIQRIPEKLKILLGKINKNHKKKLAKYTRKILLKNVICKAIIFYVWCDCSERK